MMLQDRWLLKWRVDVDEGDGDAGPSVMSEEFMKPKKKKKKPKVEAQEGGQDV